MDPEASLAAVDKRLWSVQADIVSATWMRNVLGQRADLGGALAALREILLSDDLARLSKSELASAKRLLAMRAKLLVDVEPTIAAQRLALDDAEDALIEATRAEGLRGQHGPAARAEIYERRDSFGHRVAPALRELVHARNARARSLGARDYPDVALAAAGLRSAELATWLDQFLDLPSPPCSRQADALTLLDDHAADLERAVVELRGVTARDALDRFCAAAGLELGALVDHLYIGPSLVWGEFFIAAPDDRRLVVDDTVGGFAAIKTALHELGHAVGAAARSSDYAGLVFPLPALDEGQATALEQMASEVAFVCTCLGMSERGASELASAEQRWRALHTRVLAARARFELDLYRDPEGITQVRFAELLACAAGVDPDQAAPYHWAADGHGFYTEDPLYRQNYVLAEALAFAARRSAPTESLAARLDAVTRFFVAQAGGATDGCIDLTAIRGHP